MFLSLSKVLELGQKAGLSHLLTDVFVQRPLLIAYPWKKGLSMCRNPKGKLQLTSFNVVRTAGQWFGRKLSLVVISET